MSSDEDYEYEYGSDQDFSDQEEQDDDAIEIENSYYEGDDLKTSEPAKALALFEKVVKLESERGDEVKWRFKALEQMVKLRFNLGDLSGMASAYRDMLSFMSSVTRNECTDSINSVLDTVQSSTELQVLSQIYEITLGALKSANNERLWFNTNVKLGKLYLDLGDHAKLQRTCRELHRSCKLENGADDPSKSTSLMEVYALEIQLCTATKDTARMKELYPKTLRLDAAISDPRIMGTIREEGGKMYMSEQRWKEAYDEFFEGFRNHQEAGNARAKSCLKYVVLANMLASSSINPFDSREAKVYKDELEITAMVQLRSAYEMKDVNTFEKLLRDERNGILNDPFIMTYVEPLLRNIRGQVLMRLVTPYQRIRLDFIASEINIPVEDVESLMVELILDRRIVGKIDQTRGFLVLEGRQTSAVEKKYEATNKWVQQLEAVWANTKSGSRKTHGTHRQVSMPFF